MVTVEPDAANGRPVSPRVAGRFGIRLGTVS